MRQEIEQSQDYTFTWSFYDNNIKLVPISGTIVVTKPGGDDLVSETAVSIATDGTISYTLLAANTGTIDPNYKITLSYTVSGVTTRQFYLFDIVKTPIVNTVRDEDLFQYVEELRDKNSPFVVETTSAGTAVTFISTELIPLNVDFKGGDVEISIIDTDIHSAEITAWDKNTGTVTFSPAYSTAADMVAGLTVKVRGSYQRFIDEAYNEIVIRDVRNRIGHAARFIDTTIVRNLTMFKALEMISFSKVEEVDDKWFIRAKEFKLKYKEEYSKLQEAVDYNDDGEISTREDNSRPSFLNKGLVR
jgi:hypothetical protein